MKNLLIGLLALSTLSAFAAELKCENEELRKSYTTVINYHRENLGLKSVSTDEIFSTETITQSGQISKNYPYFKTVGEFKKFIISSEAVKEIGTSLRQTDAPFNEGFLLGWTVNRNMGQNSEVISHPNCLKP